ncbi:MAG TPA: hypothetical protein VHO70_04590 [Chitinispirillaceae bacterium]|nr:hypothetical protein [Chitinispirillaceae bacterium]
MTTETNFVFKFQKRYIYAELVITAISAILLFSVWSPTIYAKITYGIIVPSALRAALVVTSTIAASIFLIHFFHKEILKTDIIITDERLIIKNPYSIKSILFSEIASVEYVKIPLYNGFLKIVTHGKTIKLPLYIENMEEFVQTFATGLVRYGRSEVIDRECITILKDASRICSSSYVRSQKAFEPLFLASMLLLIFNLIVATNFWCLSFFKLLFWCSTSWLLPVIFYIISDQYLNYLVKRAGSADKPLPEARNAYCFVLFYMVLIYFTLGWFFVSAVSA